MQRVLNQKIFFNGDIYTCNPAQPYVEAVVTFADRIIYAGPLREARQLCSSKTREVDLQGGFMLPGFIDCHTHLMWGGEYLSGIDLSTARTKAEFIFLMEEHLKIHKGRWITGGNWNQYNLVPVEMPHRRWIDAISENTPILISRMDYHMALANTKALELAGISVDTPNPQGGEIERDEDGELTGILKDSAMDLITRVIPPATSRDMKRFITRGIQEANRNGVTSVHDISTPAHIRIFQELEAENKLNCRVFSRLPIEDHEFLKETGLMAGFGSQFLKLGSMKAFVDGSLGAATAYMFEPFADEPGNRGLAMDIFLDGRLEQAAFQSDFNRLQLSIHAIGDRANKETLDLFEKISVKNPPWDRRFRIEHAQHLKPEDIARFSTLRVIASMQPYHLFEDGSWMSEKLGEERCNTSYAISSLLRAGATVCFGSDFPIVPINPLQGIYAAVTRNVKGITLPNGFGPNERISIKEAIRCYTTSAAYASFEEDEKGSIEVGKLADFALLDKNLVRIPPDQIRETKVVLTVLGGQILG